MREALARKTIGGGLLTIVWLSASSAAAQTSLEGFDASGLPAPLAPSAFSGLERTRPLEPEQLSVGLRSTYLKDLVTFALPSPSPNGTVSPAVEGTLLHELMAARSVRAGFDVGLGLALHAPLWGAGDSSVRGGEAGGATASLGDLRLGAGWSYAADEWAVRPWATLSLPAGSPSRFTGEGTVRAELGVSGSWDGGWLLAELELGVRLRPTRDVGVTRVGSGFRLGAGALLRVMDELLWGVELFFLPTWIGSDAPQNGTPAVWFPSEVRTSARYTIDSIWSVGAHVGTGLPTSRSSDLTSEPEPVRGLSSPSLRAGIEARAAF